jgi:hypothetical protein
MQSHIRALDRIHFTGLAKTREVRQSRDNVEVTQYPSARFVSFALEVNKGTR